MVLLKGHLLKGLAQEWQLDMDRIWTLSLLIDIPLTTYLFIPLSCRFPSIWYISKVRRYATEKRSPDHEVQITTVQKPKALLSSYTLSHAEQSNISQSWESMSSCMWKHWLVLFCYIALRYTVAWAAIQNKCHLASCKLKIAIVACLKIGSQRPLRINILTLFHQCIIQLILTSDASGTL